jgi:hypothetical protein
MEDNFEVLSFEMEGKWKAIELSQVMSSLSDVYNVFLAIKIKKTLTKRELDLIEYQIHDLRYFEKYWYHYIKDYKNGLIPFLPPLSPITDISKNLSISTSEIFLNINDYSSTEDFLQIYKMEFKSPGFIDLKGIGEIIKEMREFYKDIKYRNRHEEIRGELEIERLQIENINKFLELKKQYPEHPLVKTLNYNINTMKNLEKEDKLKLYDKRR